MIDCFQAGNIFVEESCKKVDCELIGTSRTPLINRLLRIINSSFGSCIMSCIRGTSTYPENIEHVFEIDRVVRTQTPWSPWWNVMVSNAANVWYECWENHTFAREQLEALLSSWIDDKKIPIQFLRPIWNRAPLHMGVVNPEAVQRLMEATRATRPAILDAKFRRKQAAWMAKTKRMRQCRRWFANDFIDEQNNDADAEKDVVSVPVHAYDEQDAVCKVSGDKLVSYFDEQLQEWRWKHAVRISDRACADQLGIPVNSVVLKNAIM